jgi:lysozyme
MYCANKAGCEVYGIPHGVYHFVEPEVDGTKQADYLFQSSADVTLNVWVLDVEWMGPGLALNLEKAVKRLKYLTACHPVIYTNANCWNTTFPVMPEWAKDCPLWVANPTTALAPYMPRGWDDWWMWQYSWTGKVDGIGTSVDLNRFGGTFDEMLMDFGNGSDIQEPEPIIDTMLFEALVEGQNVRKGPSTAYPIIGRLVKGQVIQPINIAGTSAWVEIAPGQWCAVKINSTEFMRVIRE